MATKTYLGDGVYADYDGVHLVLTTEDGRPRPTNTIYLDPACLEALEGYITRLHGSATEDEAERSVR